MDFDPSWLLLAFPAAFALGWVASRLDLRQLRREGREGPRAYFRGLSLLLNEQQDKAIDAFIEAVRNDPDAVELHFSLGALFRRRGEFERAVRVHEHLMQRADLSQFDRDRAQYALAQDFLRAGLFDRAESAFLALQDSSFASESRLALLSLHERSREWQAALEVAQALQASALGSFAQRMAHYHCELALQADARGDSEAARQHLEQARQVDPQAARPWALQAERCLKHDEPAGALAAWESMAQVRPDCMDLVADAFASAALSCGRGPQALQRLRELHEASGSVPLAAAIVRLLREGVVASRAAGAEATKDAAPDAATDEAERFLARQLSQRPSLAGARMLLETDPSRWGAAGLEALQQAVGRAARPLSRYRCAACGFESQRFFWQCPGCLGWDTLPPKTVEEL